jgi:hypothetical protein
MDVIDGGHHHGAHACGPPHSHLSHLVSHFLWFIIFLINSINQFIVFWYLPPP